MGGDSAGGWQGSQRELEGDAAIEAAAVFSCFVAQRLRSADAAWKQTGGLHTVAQQRGPNVVSALAAKRKIGSLDAGDIGVADQFDRDGLA